MPTKLDNLKLDPHEHTAEQTKPLQILLAEGEERLRERTELLAEAERMAHFGNWSVDLVENRRESSAELLQKFTQRLHQRFRESDTVARLGGDEFVVLLENSGGSDDLANLARKVRSGHKHVEV